MQWFDDNVEVLYRDAHMPLGLQIFLVILFTVAMTTLVAFIVQKCYHKKDFELSIHTLLEWIHESSQVFFDHNNKNYEGDVKKLASQLNSFLHGDSFLDEEGDAMMRDLVEQMESGDATQLEIYRDLTLFEKKVHENREAYLIKQGYVLRAIIVCLILLTPANYALTQLISFAFYSTKNASILSK